MTGTHSLTVVDNRTLHIHPRESDVGKRKCAASKVVDMAHALVQVAQVQISQQGVAIKSADGKVKGAIPKFCGPHQLLYQLFQ
jgi:hypothetical protein